MFIESYPIFFFLFSEMIYAVLRIIREPPWKLTFWTFRLWVCDVTLPQPLAPRVGKTKRTLHPLSLRSIQPFNYTYRALNIETRRPLQYKHS